MHPLYLKEPSIVPVLDRGFRPAVLSNRAYLAAVGKSPRRVPLSIALERSDGTVFVHETEVFSDGTPEAAANIPFASRLVKMLLWQYGAARLTVGGPREVGEAIRSQYAADGERAFDAQLMSDVYDTPFHVTVTDTESVPSGNEPAAHPRGRHLNGCRIGFDAGASDHKVAAVVEGEVVFSEEVPWQPTIQTDPAYHYEAITGALRRAASHMKRVDAIGVSSAGVYIDNRVKVASLFRGVPRDVFRETVRDLYLRIQKEWGGVPIEVVNDGEVAALAGSMGLDDTNVLGIALGSSEAGGYVTAEGNITSWLNELAFPAVDFQPDSPPDEWSGDRGCGGEYFSQKAAVRLARAAGIELDATKTMAEQLVTIQNLHSDGDARARQVFETIGCYMGYGIAHYADFYDLKHVMLMGRVVSGLGGDRILEGARRVLNEEFPELERAISVHLPGEASRRVGQAVAAASLPWVR